MHRNEIGARTTVLLTGFGPYPTVPRNATQWLVPHLAHHARRLFPDVHFEAVIVPTAWDEAPGVIADMIASLEPDIALHFGVSGRARGFEFETRAFNATSEIEDHRGLKSKPVKLVRGGADLRMAQFPATDMVARIRRRGISARISRDAGRYLCNAVLYHALHKVRGRGHTIRCGFIHVPTRLARPLCFGRDRPLIDAYGTWTSQLPPLPRPAPRSPLSWDDAIVGGLEAIAACLGRQLRLPKRPRLGVKS